MYLPTIDVGIYSEIAADLQRIHKKLCADPLSRSALKSADPQNCRLYFLLAELPIIILFKGEVNNKALNELFNTVII